MTAAPDLGGFPRRYCPACEQVVRARFKPGPGGRPGARCPRCGSLERDRFFALLVPMLRPALGRVDVLLEISPSSFSTTTLAAVGAERHVRLDIGYDSRLVDVLASLTELPLPDASVDLLVCYHVLEHVPDDRRAMAEIARVLSPGGLAVVEVPWKPGFATDEDPSAPEEERVRRFGQRDHVRYYGDDFEDRLREAGLVLDRVAPPQLLGDAMVEMCRLEPREFVWLVRRAAGPDPHPAAELSSALPHALDALLGQLAGQHARLLAARGRIAELETGLETGLGTGHGAGLASRLRPRRVVAAARRRVRARRTS